jgi:hypothetical protein
LQGYGGNILTLPLPGGTGQVKGYDTILSLSGMNYVHVDIIYKNWHNSDCHGSQIKVRVSGMLLSLYSFSLPHMDISIL